MICNDNEKYLLKFLADANYATNSENELFKLLNKFGIKPKFESFNPVYQIIDELNYREYIAKNWS